MGVNEYYRKDTSSKIVIGMLRDLLDEMEETLVNTHYYLGEEKQKASESKDKDLEKALDYGMVSIASIRNQKEKILDYMREIRVSYRISDKADRENLELIGKLKNMIRAHKSENERLQTELDNLKRKVSELEKEHPVNISLPTERSIVGSGQIEQLVELIQRNVKSLAVSEYLRSDEYKDRATRTGEESHRFKQDIDNDELREMYIKAKYKLTKQIVEYFNNKAKDGVTYQALRDRLVDMEIWRGRTE